MGDVTSLLASVGVEDTPLGDGAVVTYTIQVHNRGAVTATGVLLDLSSRYALRLPGGTQLPDEGHDHQVVNLGDVGPGGTGSVTVTGTLIDGAGQIVSMATTTVVGEISHGESRSFDLRVPYHAYAHYDVSAQAARY